MGSNTCYCMKHISTQLCESHWRHCYRARLPARITFGGSLTSKLQGRLRPQTTLPTWRNRTSWVTSEIMCTVQSLQPWRPYRLLEDLQALKHCVTVLQFYSDAIHTTNFKTAVFDIVEPFKKQLWSNAPCLPLSLSAWSALGTSMMSPS